jgi:hypothetical protein
MVNASGSRRDAKGTFTEIDRKNGEIACFRHELPGDLPSRKTAENIAGYSGVLPSELSLSPFWREKWRENLFSIQRDLASRHFGERLGATAGL